MDKKQWMLKQSEKSDGWHIVKYFPSKTHLSAWSANQMNMVALEKKYPPAQWRRKMDIDQCFIAVKRKPDPKIQVWNKPQTPGISKP